MVVVMFMLKVASPTQPYQLAGSYLVLTWSPTYPVFTTEFWWIFCHVDVPYSIFFYFRFNGALWDVQRLEYFLINKQEICPGLISLDCSLASMIVYFGMLSINSIVTISKL